MAKPYDVGFNLKILGCRILEPRIQGLRVLVWSLKEKKNKGGGIEKVATPSPPTQPRFEARNSSRHTSISAIS